MRKRSLTGVAGLAVVALALAACGSSGGGSGAAATSAGSTSSATSAGSTSSTSSTGTVDAGSTKLGSVLVDSQGRTLYLFQADSGTTSSCNGSCAVAWPPVHATGQPTAGTGIAASMLGTTPRTDGTSQVTYNGHPLYTFVKDTSAGQTSGEGVNAFGGLWYALSPAGVQVTGAAATPTTSSYGY